MIMKSRPLPREVLPLCAAASASERGQLAGRGAEGREGRAVLPLRPGGGSRRAVPGPGAFAGPGREAGSKTAGAPELAFRGVEGGTKSPLGGTVSFAAGDAMRLPFKDDSFDAVTISFGLRNVHGTQAALEEMYRVTRPGGRLVVCEFSRITVPPVDMLYRRYLTGALPAIARRVARNPVAYEYLAESIGDWPAQRELAAVIGAAGWSSVKWRNVSLGVVAIHVGRKLTGAAW